MAEKVAATCKGCKRAVYVEHLDRDGYCCFCTNPAPASEKKASA